MSCWVLGVLNRVELGEGWRDQRKRRSIGCLRQAGQEAGGGKQDCDAVVPREKGERGEPDGAIRGW